MPVSPVDFQTKVDKAAVNMDRWDQILNGDVNTDVSLDTGTVPTVAKAMAGIAAIESDAETSAAAAEASRKRADNTIPFDLRATLVAVSAMLIGDRGRVRASDTGTHAAIAGEYALGGVAATVGDLIPNAGDYSFDGTNWLRTGDLDSQTAATSVAIIAGFKSSMMATVQSLGMSDATITVPTGSSAGGTFTFGTPFSSSGVGLVFVVNCRTAGQLWLQTDVTRSGTNNSPVAETLLNLTAGLNIIDLPNVAYTAGHYWGFRSNSARLYVDSGDGGAGGYWTTGTLVGVGGSYTGSTLVTTTRISVRLETRTQLVTAANFATNTADIAQNKKYVGNETDPTKWIGGPEGALTTAGTGSTGTNTYACADALPQRMRAKSIRAYVVAPGTIVIRFFTRSATTMTQVSVDVPITFTKTGDQTITNLPDIIGDAGSFYAIANANGIIGVASGSTPAGLGTYAGAQTGSTFTASGATRAYTIELSVQFEPYDLMHRVAKLETNGSTSVVLTHDTKAFHFVWVLGESHAAGRAPAYSSSIPSGRGYLYRRSTGLLEQLADPTNNEGGSYGSWGPAIGQAMLDITHGAVGALIVNSGHGGTTVAEWALTTAGHSWPVAKADWDGAIAAAKAAGVPISGVTIAICIGTNDAVSVTDGTMDKATFKAGLLDLITRAKAYVNAGSDVPVVLVQTPPKADGTFATNIARVQQAEAELCREQSRVYMGTSAFKFAVANGWLNADGIHANQVANDAIGGDIAAVALPRGGGLYPAGLE